MSDPLSQALQLVKEAQLSIERIDDKTSSEDTLSRLNSAVEQLAYCRNSLSPELRFHAIYPASTSEDSCPMAQVESLLGTRQPAAIQHQSAVAEGSVEALSEESMRAQEIFTAAMQQRVAAAARSTVEEMLRETAAARRALDHPK
jgi:hypothetical protein